MFGHIVATKNMEIFTMIAGYKTVTSVPIIAVIAIFEGGLVCTHNVNVAAVHTVIICHVVVDVLIAAIA